MGGISRRMLVLLLVDVALLIAVVVLLVAIVANDRSQAPADVAGPAVADGGPGAAPGAAPDGVGEAPGGDDSVAGAVTVTETAGGGAGDGGGSNGADDDRGAQDGGGAGGGVSDIAGSWSFACSAGCRMSMTIGSDGSVQQQSFSPSSPEAETQTGTITAGASCSSGGYDMYTLTLGGNSPSQLAYDSSADAMYEVEESTCEVMPSPMGDGTSEWHRG